MHCQSMKSIMVSNMKVAVVTGGTSGMGLGVAKMLLSKGYYVYATYVGPDFTEEIENFEAIKCDQTNREDVYRFINYVKSKTIANIIEKYNNKENVTII